MGHFLTCEKLIYSALVLFAVNMMKKQLYQLFISDIALSVNREFGTIFLSKTPAGSEVFIANPEDISVIFRTEPKYPVRPAGKVASIIRKEHGKDAGVFFGNGEEWYKHRSALSKKMLRPPEINKYIPRLNDIVTDVIGRVEKLRKPDGTSNAFEVDNLDMEFFRWAFESVTDLLFDKRFGTLTNNPSPQAIDFITSLGNFLKYFVRSSFLPRAVLKYHKPKSYKETEINYLKLYSHAEKLIKEKLQELHSQQALGESDFQENDTQEFIPYLLSTKEINEKDLEASIVDTFFAGVDTTSNTMGWILYELSRNQESQNKLHEEVDSVLNKDRAIDTKSLEQMPYLKAVIKETLRLYPVAIVTNRVIPNPVVLSGYEVPAGMTVNMMHYAMGRMDRYFTEPSKFKPERWLRDNMKSNVSSFASIPFGFGTRMCIGRRLALLEMQLLLSRLIHRFKLEYPDGECVERVMRGPTVPDRPLRIKFLDRQ